ncbi:MAG: class I SAM-dependent methyltransferase [Halieaceae bacterium]|jgi:SAM-dependent methyltransferase|nr:class I SAM-dependent methyltransferase [Halieaceae bacterium]
MKAWIRNLIIGTPLEGLARRIMGRPRVAFESSPQYWESRYQSKGNSGSGSYGKLAEFKAGVLNDFVSARSIQSVIEFGCGDGNQLALANYPNYIGIDVSHTAVDLCTERFAGDASKRFVHSSDYGAERADLSLSLDVIFHLVEEQVFETYMADLFEAASRYVIVYSSNSDVDGKFLEHVRHRRFTDWVEANRTDFQLVEHIPNRFPYDDSDPDNTSFADFYIFERIS